MDAGGPLGGGGPDTPGVGDVLAAVQAEIIKPDPRQRQQLALALLGGALLTVSLRRLRWSGVLMAAGGGWLLYRTLGGRQESQGGGALEGKRVVTVGGEADELYRIWRDPENTTRIMGHIAEVTPTDTNHAHWRMPLPGGRTFEWDAVIIESRPGELLRWQSMPGAELPNEGELTMRPAPGNRGTEVTLRMRFQPPPGLVPGGPAGAVLRQLPSLAVGDALRRFKSLAETGEIPTLDRNPSARVSV
ncbi:hypothetical protein DAETH_34090 (plasmid) [Deinococcus aetherius]|uniref:Coenzyme Q-binding protein COQ10 START domain-containing protein n=1 Tax=Deinococcus aetherius TaxID=200252 RepID=A0ABN6RKR7_9DEIO|nr:SRPBCC family protein [Deinococcus aetherius]BDP43440.1 hypothetical protein DAETH_34090 [Deinococcus aetherius]